MTPTLAPCPPREAVAVERLEARLDDRLADVLWSSEQRWEHFGPPTRDWLREVIQRVLGDVRQDILDVVRDRRAPSHGDGLRLRPALPVVGAKLGDGFAQDT